MHRRQALALLVAAAAVAGTATAGGISGTVVAAEDGSPLRCDVEVLTTAGDWVASGLCDVHGAYQVDGLTSGSYVVRAAVPDEPDRVALYWDHAVFWDQATPVQVEDDGITPGIDLRLSLGGRVAGTVRQGRTGDTLAGIGLAVHTAPGWRWSRYVTSGDDGSYSAAGIPPGTYLVQAFDETGPHVKQYWDHAHTEADATPLTLVATELIDAVDFDLLLEASVAGRVVVTGTNAPVADAFVEANDLSGRFRQFARTDDTGSFRIGRLHPSTYRVRAEAEGFSTAFALDDGGRPAELELAEAEAATDLLILLARGGAISGTVTRAADGSPAASVHVFAWHTEAQTGIGADSDENGAYRIDGLPAGPYQVVADPPDDVNLVPLRYPHEVIVVVGEEVAGIDLALEAGGHITGRVTASADGRPVEGAQIAATDVHGWLTRSTASDGTGAFRLAGLATADYLVTAHHPDFAVQTYDRSLLPEGGSPVHAVAGETTTGVAFELDQAGKITGTVRAAATGEPVPEVLVTAALYDGVLVPGAWTLSAGDGAFVLDSVPAGTAYVLAADDKGRYAWQWYVDAPTFAGAVPLAVAVGATVPDVDLWLAPPGEVSVTPRELSFTGTPYQDDVAAQTLTVRNAGPGAAALDVWSEADWLCVDADLRETVIPAGRQLDVAVSVLPSGLAPGAYATTLHAVDLRTGIDHAVAVTLRLDEAPPQVEIAPRTLWFDAEQGLGPPPARVVSLTNLGSDDTGFTVTSAAPWLAITPAQGTVRRGDAAAALSVELAPEGLESGPHTGTLTVSSNAGDTDVVVHLELAPAAGGDPRIVAPDHVSLLVPPDPPGSTSTTTVEIGNGGTGTLHWNARTTAPWLSIEPARGSLDQGSPAAALTLTAHVDRLPPGVHSAVVTVASSREEHPIELTVQVGSVVALESLAASSEGRLVIPVLAHADGQHGSRFVSDLWLSRRPATGNDEVTLAFVPEGEDGTRLAVLTRLELGPGHTVALLDLVEDWLGQGHTKGSLIIITGRIDEYQVTSRTYNETSKQGASPTFGQVIPGLSSHDAVGRLEGALFVPGLARSSAFRSNLLITEVSGQPATAMVELADADGHLLGATEVDLLPFATTQLNDVFAAVGHAGDADTALAAVEVVSGAGRIVVLGSVVDNTTNDPTTVPGSAKSRDASLVVPVVARGDGLAGTRWTSDVAVANADTRQRRLTVHYRDRDGVLRGSRETDLEGGRSLRLADVVGSFGLSSSRGSLHLETSPPGGLVVASRTYNSGSGGTFGQGIDAVERDRAIAAGGDTLRLIALHNTARYRTNLGITELQGEGARVAVTVSDAAGTEVLGYRELQVPAWGQLQINVFAAIGRSDVHYAATATLQVLSGGGAITAYASMVDSATGDATTLPPPHRVAPGAFTVPPIGGP
jgi:hypothetical protein